MIYIVIDGIKINNPDVTIINREDSKFSVVGFTLRTHNSVFCPLFRNGNKVPFGFGHQQGRVVLQEYHRSTDENGYHLYDYKFMLTGPVGGGELLKENARIVKKIV